METTQVLTHAYAVNSFTALHSHTAVIRPSPTEFRGFRFVILPDQKKNVIIGKSEATCGKRVLGHFGGVGPGGRVEQLSPHESSRISPPWPGLARESGCPSQTTPRRARQGNVGGLGSYKFTGLPPSRPNTKSSSPQHHDLVCQVPTRESRPLLHLVQGTRSFFIDLCFYPVRCHRSSV